MQINPDKCGVIRITNRKSKNLTVPYSIHNSVLLEVKAAKYLGVTIDDRLTWDERLIDRGEKCELHQSLPPT